MINECTLPLLPNLTQNTEEWLAWRCEGIGASEIAALYRKHPYLTEYQLWLQKTGQSTRDISSCRDAIDYGHAQEPIAFDSLKNDHNFFDLISGCIQHPTLPHLRASLDAYTPSGELIIEIKSPFGQQNKSIKIYEAIPEYWIYQMQYQQAIARQYQINLKLALFKWIGKGECNLLFSLRSDFDLQADMLQKADHWWKHHVVMGNPVKPDMIFLSQKGLLDKLSLYEEYQSTIKHIDEQKRALKCEIEEFLDGASNYCTDTHQIIRMSPRSSYDYQAMQRDGINLSKYATKKTDGTYLIKKKKKEISS